MNDLIVFLYLSILLNILFRQNNILQIFTLVEQLEPKTDLEIMSNFNKSLDKYGENLNE